MTLLRAAVLLALALPGLARAGEATIVSRDEPVRGARVLAAARAPIRFDLVGLHWRGSGAVSFRTHGLDGRWSGWRPAAPEAEDLPDPASSESAATKGWRLGNPYWTGPSDRIEYRLAGRVRRLRAYFVWSSPGVRPVRELSIAGSPSLVPRFSWSADESIRRRRPRYAAAVRFAIVHHTAGANDYAPQDSAAIVRGIELYHVKGNGWNDVGYNFLVDKYGQVFEGRYGGVDRAVVGAHAEGFNTGSVGIAVLGNYQDGAITPAAEAALARLLAWRLDLAHVDPLSTLSWISGGNLRFPAGIPVFLRAVSGHRDTGFTECPGNALYAQIPTIAADAAALGLPKLYDATADGEIGGRIRIAARLSSARPWNVTVTDTTGQTVAGGHGKGTQIAWTWDATPAPPGRYTWTIDAGSSVRSARGQLGRDPARPPPLYIPPTPAPPGVYIPPTPAPPAPLIEGFSLSPTIVSPNDDGSGDSSVVGYTLTGRALVTATVLEQGGAPLVTLFTDQEQSAKAQFFPWLADALPDGRYKLVITARRISDGSVETASSDVLVDRTLSHFSAAPPFFSPNGHGQADTVTFTFNLAQPALVTLRILEGGQLATLAYMGRLAPGPQQLSWDGKTALGPVADGVYQAVLAATDEFGDVAQAVDLIVDSTPPGLTLLDGPTLTFSLSEPAQVVLLIGGQRAVYDEPAGQFRIPAPVASAAFTAVAWDQSGNSSPVTAYTAPSDIAAIQRS